MIGTDLCKLFYVDIMFSKYTHSLETPIGKGVIEQKLKELTKQAEQLSATEIKDEVEKVHVDNVKWLERYNNKTGVKQSILLDECVTDGWHANIDDIEVSHGTKLNSFLETNKSNSKVRQRLTEVDRYFGVLTHYLPVVVMSLSNKTVEVMSGNHRIMVAIERGLVSIDALMVNGKTSQLSYAVGEGNC